jgi:hypothetical protein
MNGSVCSLLVVLVLCAFAVVRADAQAPAFELEDQYGKSHKVEFPRPRITVITFADRAGSSQLEGWIRPLYERYLETIDIHGVAKLAGVPRLMRSLLRAIFRKNLTYPVMMDWTGAVSMNYGYEARVANVVVLSPEGRIEYRFNGKAGPEELQKCFARIDALRPTPTAAPAAP